MPRSIHWALAAACLALGPPHSSCAADAPSAAGSGGFPRVPPTPAARAVATFETLPGFRVELLAAEPLVTDPVALEYDERGRAWVVEMRDYPYTDKSTDQPFVERTTDAPLGRVRILTDDDGDGRFDRSDLFADELSWPTGIALYDGGAFVTATPDLWYLKDTDGDGRADLRRRVATGFRKFNVQAVMNNPRWGVDHWLYAAGGSNGGTITLPDADGAPRTLGRADFRLHPVTGAFELESGGQRFGHAFDDEGRRFLCNIRNPVQHVVLPYRYLARNRALVVPAAIHDVAEAGDTVPVYRLSPPEPWRAVRAERWAAEPGQHYPQSELNAAGYFTSSSGVVIYRGDAYPAEYRDNAFLGEVAGNLVHRQVLSPLGVTFRSIRGEPAGTEFLRSTDNWFRPVNLANAPDGTLHLVDMYRETIEHPWSIPDDLKAQLDLESGRDRGRVYRIVPEGFQPRPAPDLRSASTGQLVRLLEHANGWHRDTAHRLLFERQDPAAVDPLRMLLRAGESPHARMLALWSLEGLGALRPADLEVGLEDRSPLVREHAVRLAERTPLADRLPAMADDPDPRVRFQVALSLGETPGPVTIDALARIAARDSHDPWVRSAVLSSASGRAIELLETLPNRLGETDVAGQADWARELAALVAVEGAEAEYRRALAVAGSLVDGPRAAAVEPLLQGLQGGLRRRGHALSEYLPADGPLRDYVDKLLADARRDAAAPGPAETRVAAVERLALGGYGAVGDTLLALVDLRQPAEVQAAAVRVAAGFAEPGVAERLVAAFARASPGARALIVESLLARTAWVGTLLGAIESGRIPAVDVAPTRRQLLVAHRDAEIQRRARALWGEDRPGSRQAVVAEYRAALTLVGDPARGREIYRRECRGCHRWENEGFDVGPSLLTVRHRSPEELVTHVMDPSREVAPNFQEYVVALEDGRILTGLIAEETATSLVLRKAENVRETVLRDEIEELQATGRSLMPDGMEKKLTPQDLADLVALLRGASVPAAAGPAAATPAPGPKSPPPAR